MHEEKLLLVALVSIRKHLLKTAHDNAGTDQTMAHLLKAVRILGRNG